MTMILLISCNKGSRIKVLKTPEVSSSWWLIAPKPIGELELPTTVTMEGHKLDYEPNDHHIFQDKQGIWHLWACVRDTEVGRILYHWKTDDLTASPWQSTGEYIRSDTTYGESLVDWYGFEFIQSPFIVETDSLFYMFYGGSATGVDAFGNKTTS